jgi:flagellar biosynthesis protein FlhB
VACSISWDYNSLIVSDGTDYIFRVKHFINYIKTNIIIFIIGMIIKFSLTKESNEVFDSLFFYLGLRD